MNSNSPNPWKWVAIGAAIIVVLSCGLCVITRVACSRAEDAIAAGFNEALQTPSAPSLPTTTRPFDALASQLHVGRDHREGPGAFLVADAGFADEYTGAAIRVFETPSGPRIAFLQADTTLRDVSRSERESWVREVAQELENVFPNAGILYAIRGRLIFGASAMKMDGASSWQFQTGAAINNDVFDAFFAGAIPRQVPVALGEDAHTVTGEFTPAGAEPDCTGYPIPLRPALRLQLAADRPQLTIEAEAPDRGLGLVIRRPDGVLRCEIEFEHVELAGRFPPGTYDVWVGALVEDDVEANAFTLRAQAAP